jgi:hypothetical protein
MKALEFDLQKTLIRINEIEKIVESRNYDIKNKNVNLNESEREIARMKDLNN